MKRWAATSLLAVAGFAVVAVALLLWSDAAVETPTIAREAPADRNAPPREVPPEVRAPAIVETRLVDVPEVDLPSATPEDGVEDGGRRLEVASDVSMPLASVHLRRGGRAWVERSLDGGDLHLSGSDVRPDESFELRAPGHEATLVTPAAERVMLNAVVAVTLHGHDLSDARVLGGHFFEPSETLSWSPSEDEWACVLDPSAILGTEILGQVLAGALVVDTGDGLRVRLDMRFQRGLRASAELRDVTLPPTLPLDIHVASSTGTEVGRLDVEIDLLSGSGVASMADEVVHSESYEWGALSIAYPRLVRRTVEGSDVFRIERGYVGKEITVAAREAGSGRFGRLRFLHDGTPRTLRLREPLRIRGRLMCPTAPIDATSGVCNWKDVGAPDAGWPGVKNWRQDSRVVEIEGDGGFEVDVSPKSILLSDDARRPVVEAVLRIPRFRIVELTADFARDDVVDVGQVQLVPLSPLLGLIPPESGEVPAGGVAEFCCGPSLGDCYATSRRIEKSDSGRWNVYGENDERLPDAASRAGSRGSLHWTSGDKWFLVRRPDGLFERVAESSRRVVLDIRALPEGSGVLDVRLAWTDPSAEIETVTRLEEGSPGCVVDETFRVPESDVWLTWSNSVTSGVVPLTESVTTLSLP